MKVIVPSAKLIPPELQSIGKIPAIVYPINQSISFDFFKLKYDGIASEIDIICFENAAKVREVLANYKLSSKLNLLELEKLEELGHSVYRGLTDDDGEIIIHFADTIVMDSLPFDEKNFFCSAQEYSNEMWTFYNLNEGRICAVNDKKSPTPPFDNKLDKYNFFVGVFKLSNGAYFKKCLERVWKNPNLSMDSFYAALILYSETYKFCAHEVKNWFDIGHAPLYFKTRMKVKARLFNHIEIDYERGILKKTSRDVEKFIGEIKWYLKLPVDLEYVRPRIFDYSLHYSKPYVRMEYYSYRTLHELFVYGDLTNEQWEKIFRKIKFVLDDFSRYKLRDAALSNSVRSMYLEKTLQRLQKLKAQPEFVKLFSQPVCIDGIFYKPLDEIIKILESVISQFLLKIESFSIIHGDFCFPNIMIDDNFNFIKLIDPRGKFGEYDIYGDPRYEFAKLLHSLEGKYDFIIKDLFDLKINGENNFSFKILDSNRNLSEIFFGVFNDDLKKIVTEVRLIEALLFLSMIPMHKDSSRRQFAMLFTGLKILNELIPVGA